MKLMDDNMSVRVRVCIDKAALDKLLAMGEASAKIARLASELIGSYLTAEPVKQPVETDTLAEAICECCEHSSEPELGMDTEEMKELYSAFEEICATPRLIDTAFEILKDGSLNDVSGIITFCCEVCSCEFRCGSKHYLYDTVNDVYSVACPTCNNIAYAWPVLNEG